MASSSSSSYGEEQRYPYPSHVCAPNFVTVKLSGRDMYDVWRTQVLCLLESHDMVDFITLRALGKEKADDHKLWKRSDALVKGWILGSLSEHILKYVLILLKQEFTAKDLWDQLKTIYGPPLLQKEAAATTDLTEIEEIEEEDKLNEQKESKKRKVDEKTKLHQSLYAATQSQNYNKVYTSLKEGKVRVTEGIIPNGNTALHLVVGTTKNKEILKKMLQLAPEDIKLTSLINSDGSTLLHVAAIFGNTEAAKILVKKDKGLLTTVDNEGHTPLGRALCNMNFDTHLYLVKAVSSLEENKAIIFEGARGDELLVNAISSKDFDLARKIIKNYSGFSGQAVLMAIAQNFPRLPKSWVSDYEELWFDDEEDFAFAIILAVSIVASVSVLVFKKSVSRWMIYPRIVGGIFLAIIVIPAVYMPLKFIIKRVMHIEDKMGSYYYAKYLLEDICEVIKLSKNSESHHEYYKHAILEASKQNADEVVREIVDHFPNAIWSVNEEGHNIIQQAVIYRSKRVYNLLYQMSEHKNIYKTIKDPCGNNLLHLAARLAPPDKLNLISGAALQIQYELQWFKEVSGFVCPLNIKQKNSFGETPQMVFTREHKELVIEGEKWMKATAESYSITAALITTIMFSSAITVPGGNNENTGNPIFTTDTAFTIFAVR